jgi:hypothetical protein
MICVAGGDTHKMQMVAGFGGIKTTSIFRCLNKSGNFCKNQFEQKKGLPHVLVHSVLIALVFASPFILIPVFRHRFQDRDRFSSSPLAEPRSSLAYYCFSGRLKTSSVALRPRAGD